MFDTNFYAVNVGMIPAAAQFFCHWVGMELRRVHGVNQSRIGGEGKQSRVLDEGNENFEP
jgi:hypothetical protein